jgi:peptide/nickel transport system permease protein
MSDDGWHGRLGRSRRVRRLLRHRLFLIGAVVLGLIVIAALAAPLVAPFDPVQMQRRARFRAPALPHLFGTDNFGRDVLSRVLYGARLSLQVGAAVVVVTGLVGTAIGAMSGYFRRVDDYLMRLMDAMMAFPAVLLAIGITAALGPSLLNVVIALSVAYTPRTARIVRASVLVVRSLDFVEAARAAGAGHARILLGHILPNCTGPLIVQLTFIFAYAVLAEAVLSFLGMGPAPPTPTWGNIVAEGRNYVREAAWISAFPGVAIAVTVLALNLVGDGLRDVFDPRMRVEN